MIPAAIASLLVQLAPAPVAATCPRGSWVNGIRPDGSYECLFTRGDNDSPAFARVRGRITCTDGERPIVLDDRRVACVRARSFTPNSSFTALVAA